MCLMNLYGIGLKLEKMNYKPGEISSFNDTNLPLWQRGVRQGGKMNRKVMGSNLLTFKKVLDKYNVVFVIIFGGLLGIIRNGNFIPWDEDLDIACFDGGATATKTPDHWKMKKIKKDLKKEGFRIIGSDQHHSYHDFFIRGGERIEIFWFKRIESIESEKTEWIMNTSVRYPAHYFDELDEIDFLGTKFKVPSNAEEFLERTYGKSWKKPNKKARYLNLNLRKREENE